MTYSDTIPTTTLAFLGVGGPKIDAFLADVGFWTAGFVTSRVIDIISPSSFRNDGQSIDAADDFLTWS